MVSFFQPLNTKKQAKPSQKKWKRIHFVAGGPVASIGLPEISQGGRFIRSLVAVFQGRSIMGGPIQTYESGRINVTMTAILLGISEEELRQRFSATRKSTKRTAYTLSVLGALSLALWIYGALHMPLVLSRVVSAVEFLPLCALFFILAFRCAWTNWQLRTMRLGSAADYLRTTDPFWPC